MRATITAVALTAAIISAVLISGCVEYYTQGKGPQPLGTEPAPPWVKNVTEQYLENKLGKDYLNEYIVFKDAVTVHWSEYDTYQANYIYNHPYDGDREFRIELASQDRCCTDNGPAKPHSFSITREKAIQIAQDIGMKRYDGVRFLFHNTLIVEHNPPNPYSKNMVSINNNNGDYVLEVYVAFEKTKKDEISSVYIDTDTGDVIGYYIAPEDYNPTVSTPPLQLPRS